MVRDNGTRIDDWVRERDAVKVCEVGDVRFLLKPEGVPGNLTPWKLFEWQLL